MISKGAVTLVGAQGSESIFGKDSVAVFNSSGYTKIISTGWVKVVKCESLGHVTGKDFVKVLNCQNIQSVYSEADLDLINSKINGDVKFSGQGLFKNSQIEGTLITNAMEVLLDNTVVHNIFVKKAKQYTARFKHSPKVAYMLNRPATPIRQVRFGAHSLATQTYSANMPDAYPAHQPQTISLLNHSAVTGVIHFENGNGRILIARGQPFNATVEGGEVDYLK